MLTSVASTACNETWHYVECEILHLPSFFSFCCSYLAMHLLLLDRSCIYSGDILIHFVCVHGRAISPSPVLYETFLHTK